MDNKAGRVLKEVLFYSITIGLGFHLHYQIMGGAKESAKQEQKQENNVAVPASSNQNSDSTMVDFNSVLRQKSELQKTR